MNDDREKEIRYKWNSKTATGYRLRYDAKDARRGGKCCYHVQDWTQHVVMEDWGCTSLDEALGILKDLIDIDVGQERHRLEVHFPLQPDIADAASGPKSDVANRLGRELRSADFESAV